jgi:hypothetical protein
MAESSIPDWPRAARQASVRHLSRVVCTGGSRYAAAPLRGRGGRHRHHRLRGLGPKDDNPCERDQNPEQIPPAVTSIAQSPDSHGEVRQQDRDAPEASKQRGRQGWQIGRDPDGPGWAAMDRRFQ